MKDDWNPYFQRKKKRNRVSRGQPKRRRRYFFWPIAWTVLTVWAIQMGALGGLRLFGQEVAKDANRFYTWATTPSACDDTEKELQRVSAILAQAQAVIEYMARDLNREKAAAEREYREIENKQRIVIDRDVGVSWTVHPPEKSAATAKTIRLHPISETGTGSITVGGSTSSTGWNWTVRPSTVCINGHTVAVVEREPKTAPDGQMFLRWRDRKLLARMQGGWTELEYGSMIWQACPWR